MTCVADVHVVGPFLEWRSPTQHPFSITFPTQKGRLLVTKQSSVWKGPFHPPPPQCTCTCTATHHIPVTHALWSQACTLPPNNRHWMTLCPLEYTQDTDTVTHTCMYMHVYCTLCTCTCMIQEDFCTLGKTTSWGCLFNKGCSVQCLETLLLLPTVVRNKWY